MSEALEQELDSELDSQQNEQVQNSGVENQENQELDDFIDAEYQPLLGGENSSPDSSLSTDKLEISKEELESLRSKAEMYDAINSNPSAAAFISWINGEGKGKDVRTFFSDPVVSRNYDNLKDDDVYREYVKTVLGIDDEDEIENSLEDFKSQNTVSQRRDLINYRKELKAIQDEKLKKLNSGFEGAVSSQKVAQQMQEQFTKDFVAAAKKMEERKYLVPGVPYTQAESLKVIDWVSKTGFTVINKNGQFDANATFIFAAKQVLEADMVDKIRKKAKVDASVDYVKQNQNAGDTASRTATTRGNVDAKQAFESFMDKKLNKK